MQNASCCCGRLHLSASGDPVTVSMCHCFECQKRTGSVVAVQARFKDEQLTVEGESKTYRRKGDTGASVTFHFCPLCGTVLYWKPERLPGFTLVAVGAFSDPDFPPPKYSVYEARRHPWLKPAVDMEHYD